MRQLSPLLFLPLLACASTPERPVEAAPAAAEPAAEAPTEAPAFTLEPAELIKEKLDAGAVLVDVRPAKWFQEGHVSGAANVPWQSFDPAAVEGWAGADKAKPIVVYCGNGSQAARIRDELKALGYADVSAQSIKVVREVKGE